VPPPMASLILSRVSAMRLLFIGLVLLGLVACGGGGSTAGDGPVGPSDDNTDGTNSLVTQKIVQNGLAIFGRADVSPSFLANVGKAYEAMLQISSHIERATRNSYNSTISAQYVYQRVGKGDPSHYSEMGEASTPYGDNAVDYVFQIGSGADQIGEVFEHLLPRQLASR
jgi:hypothetical protein